MLKSVQREVKGDAIALVEERFARRLAEEIGKLRVEMHDEIGKLRAEMYNLRADIIKWMFVFWISQLLTLIGIVIALVKLLG